MGEDLRQKILGAGLPGRAGARPNGNPISTQLVRKQLLLAQLGP